MLEAKPIVEGRLTDQHAPLSPQPPNGLQAVVDKCLTNALSLIARGDSERSEGKPAVVLSTDLDRREGNLPHNIAIHFGDQRNGQGVVGPQTLDD